MKLKNPIATLKPSEMKFEEKKTTSSKPKRGVKMKLN